MKVIKCFITSKSVIVDDITAVLNPPLSTEEFASDIAIIRGKSEELSEQRLRDFGLKLFKRVFTGSVLERYQSTDPAAVALTADSALASIPWELLHDGNNWIARTRGLMRIAMTGRSAPEIIPKPGALRILAAIAGPILDESIPDDDPNQIDPIDVDAYSEMLQRLEGEPFPAEIKVRKHITRKILSYEMSDNYHVFHFTGNGSIRRLAFESRYATLDFADEVWIREQMTVGLRGNLRFAIINTCHSPDKIENPYDVAVNILSAGVPVVAVMQGSMSKLAEFTFTKILYGFLSKGKSIDEAMLEARRAIAADWQMMAYDWAMPVMFVNDSLLEKEASLNIIDSEMAEMIPSPKMNIVFPPESATDLLMTREQKLAGRRQELSEILRLLDPEQQDGAQIVCLHSDPGIGKTAIAIEAVRRMAEWFKKIIVISNGTFTDQISKQASKKPEGEAHGELNFLKNLAYKCGAETGDEEPLHTSIIKSLSGSEWKLLVLDNLGELARSEAVKNLLSSLPANCKLLITSLKPIGVNEKLIQVGMLNKSDSSRLFALKGFQFASGDMNDIIHITGGHPMSICLAVSQAKSAGKALSSVLKDLRKAKDNILDYLLEGSLKLALRDGRKVFSALALFHPTASRKALQEVCRLNDDAFDKALKRVVVLSLIESYQQGKRFGLHQLAKIKAEQQLEKDTDKVIFRERMAEFFAALVSVTAPMTELATAVNALESQMPEGTPRYQLENAAIELIVKPAKEILELELFNCLIALEWAVNKSDINNAATFLNGMGELLASHGYVESMVDCWMKLAREQKKLGDNLAYSAILSNLGLLYYKRGKKNDSIKCYEEAHKAAQESKDRSLEAQTLESLGIVYREQGDWNKAIESFENSGNIFQSLGDEIKKANIFNNIGILYRQIGQLDSAIQSFESSREIFERYDNKQSKANTIGNLAVCYQEKGQYEDAIKYYEDASRIYKNTGNEFERGLMLEYLGNLYARRGNLNLALQCSYDSLAIMRQIGDRYNMQIILDNIAHIYSMQEEYLKTGNTCIESYQLAIQLDSSTVIDTLVSILDVCRYMLKSGEFAIPAQLASELSLSIEGLDVSNDEMRTALAISQGIFTIIGFVSAAEWNKENNIYKEALELASSLDKKTGSVLKLVDWLEKD